MTDVHAPFLLYQLQLVSTGTLPPAIETWLAIALLRHDGAARRIEIGDPQPLYRLESKGGEVTIERSDDGAGWYWVTDARLDSRFWPGSFALSMLLGEIGKGRTPAVVEGAMLHVHLRGNRRLDGQAQAAIVATLAAGGSVRIVKHPGDYLLTVAGGQLLHVVTADESVTTRTLPEAGPTVLDIIETIGAWARRDAGELLG